MEIHEYDAMARVEDAHWWYRGMRRITTTLLRNIPAPQTIVDAGCGTGGTLRHLPAATTAVGFDASPTALTYAQSRGSTVFRADIQAIPLSSQHADLVTCFDVLYHRAVTDDAAAFRELARITAPGGYVCIRVPAHDWLRSQHDANVHTQRRYEPAHLRALCAANGLTIYRLTYVNCGLLPLIVLKQWWSRGTADTTHSSALQVPPWYEQSLGTVALWIEALLLRVGISLPYGVSLMCLAQRPALPTETE